MVDDKHKKEQADQKSELSGQRSQRRSLLWSGTPVKERMGSSALPEPTMPVVAPSLDTSSIPALPTPASLGLDRANIKRDGSRSGNIYLEFENVTDMNIACANLSRVLGNQSYKITADKRTIQIYPDVHKVLGIESPVHNLITLGLNKATIRTYDDAPGNVYAVFKNATDMELAREKIASAYGESAFRQKDGKSLQIFSQVQRCIGSPATQLSLTNLGLSAAAIKTDPTKPGSCYLAFPDSKSMEAACTNLSATFGGHVYRPSSEENTIQIYREIQDLIKTAPLSNHLEKGRALMAERRNEYDASRGFLSKPK